MKMMRSVRRLTDHAHERFDVGEGLSSGCHCGREMGKSGVISDDGYYSLKYKDAGESQDARVGVKIIKDSL